MNDAKRRPRDDEFQMPSFRLEGRTALVTGGSRGLGLGLALSLAHAGADLGLVARSRQDLAAAAELVRRTGRRAEIFEADVADAEAARGAVTQAAARLGRLDILVNCAGMNLRQPATSLHPGGFRPADVGQPQERVLRVAGRGPRDEAAGRGRHPERHLDRGRGRPSEHRPLRDEQGRDAADDPCLALEWAKDGIRVNAVAPGRFWTAMTDAVFTDPALYDSAVGVIPMGRPGVAADLAGAAVLLCSDAAAYITGQTIVVDGGWLSSAGVKA